MKAYPTRYKEQVFRSRLEARWAAFFDLLGWPYVYEPFDLDNYIPDFILKFYEPLLVEVKPEVRLEDLKQYADKIVKSGWDKESLIVGADFLEYEGFKVIGLLGQTGPWRGEKYEDGPYFQAGVLFRCTNCGQPSIYHLEESWHCRVNGCYDGDHYLSPFEEAEHFWALAHEKTRWCPRADKNEER